MTVSPADQSSSVLLDPNKDFFTGVFTIPEPSARALAQEPPSQRDTLIDMHIERHRNQIADWARQQGLSVDVKTDLPQANQIQMSGDRDFWLNVLRMHNEHVPPFALSGLVLTTFPQ